MLDQAVSEPTLATLLVVSFSCIFKYVLCLQEGERQRLQREVEARKSKAHRRSLGLIILFGELFKVEMLKESISHKCINKLLSSCLEDSFQCF